MLPFVAGKPCAWRLRWTRHIVSILSLIWLLARRWKKKVGAKAHSATFQICNLNSAVKVIHLGSLTRSECEAGELVETEHANRSKNAHFVSVLTEAIDFSRCGVNKMLVSIAVNENLELLIIISVVVACNECTGLSVKRMLVASKHRHFNN